MKNLIRTVAFSAALIAGSNAVANTDADKLAACKAEIVGVYGDVERAKVANINSKRNLFKAKFRVRASGESSVYSCEIRDEQPIAVSCLKGACTERNIAAN